MKKPYLEWIGVGAASNVALGNTSFLVVGETRTLLVDCGFTVTPKLVEQEKLEQVTDIIITHQHGDHIFGLEALAFAHHYGFNHRDDKRPTLHLENDGFAQKIWERTLRGGLESIEYNGVPVSANLETYFKVQTGTKIQIQGLPQIALFPTCHVKNMENYGVYFDNGVYYSGDTIQMPWHTPRIIFQDCQFFESEHALHTTYNKLNNHLPKEVKAKTHLVHLGRGHSRFDPIADGFAGFVKPGDRFQM